MDFSLGLRVLEARTKALGVNMLRPEKQLLLFLVVKTLEFRRDVDRGVRIDYGSPTEKFADNLRILVL